MGHYTHKHSCLPDTHITMMCTPARVLLALGIILYVTSLSGDGVRWIEAVIASALIVFPSMSMYEAARKKRFERKYRKEQFEHLMRECYEYQCVPAQTEVQVGNKEAFNEVFSRHTGKVPELPPSVHPMLYGLPVIENKEMQPNQVRIHSRGNDGTLTVAYFDL